MNDLLAMTHIISLCLGLNKNARGIWFTLFGYWHCNLDTLFPDFCCFWYPIKRGTRVPRPTLKNIYLLPFFPVFLLANAVHISMALTSPGFPLMPFPLGPMPEGVFSSKTLQRMRICTARVWLMPLRIPQMHTLKRVGQKINRFLTNTGQHTDL